MEAQLLGEVVAHERAELEEAKERLLLSLAADTRQLQDLQDRILKLLKVTCPALPCLTVPGTALPYPALPYGCLELPCPALPCLTVPGMALPCPALPYCAWHCPA